MTSVDWPAVDVGDVEWIDTAGMIEVDRVMVDELKIELIQMMENAGRNLADLVVGLYRPTSVVVYAGSGGNGGGGLVAARHLFNRGIEVAVMTSKPGVEFVGVTRHQFDIIENLGIAVVDEHVDSDVSVDALIGYSLRGAPRGRAHELIETLAAEGPPIVSLDVPSGLDSSTGETPGASVRADATLTLAMPKVGLRAHADVGRLFAADISVPNSVFGRLGLSRPRLFAKGPIVEIKEAARP